MHALTSGIVTLTTDFGSLDSYVAEMKGVMLSTNPRLTLIDVSHSIPAQDVAAGAYILRRAVDHFPAGTVHLAVVDPGVGSGRRGLAIEGPTGCFVGPDNGVFALVLSESSDRDRPDLVLSADYRAVSLTNRGYWRPDVASTFHGRDIFAPVAARLASGEDLGKFGEPLDSIRGLPSPTSEIDECTIKTSVVWIDKFGNAILAVHHREFSDWKGCAVAVGGREVAGPVVSYEQAREPGLLVGSAGLLEIAVYRGSAAEVLGLKRGDEVTVRRLD